MPKSLSCNQVSLFFKQHPNVTRFLVSFTASFISLFTFAMVILFSKVSDEAKTAKTSFDSGVFTITDFLRKEIVSASEFCRSEITSLVNNLPNPDQCYNPPNFSKTLPQDFGTAAIVISCISLLFAGLTTWYLKRLLSQAQDPAQQSIIGSASQRSISANGPPSHYSSITKSSPKGPRSLSPGI